MSNQWNIHSTPAGLLGKLIFRSTLTGQFQIPDEKRFRASCPWLKLEIYWLDGRNLAINETEVFKAIQNLTNVNQLWNVSCLKLLNFCIGKPWSITPKLRHPERPQLQWWTCEKTKTSINTARSRQQWIQIHNTHSHWKAIADRIQHG